MIWFAIKYLKLNNCHIWASIVNPKNKTVTAEATENAELKLMIGSLRPKSHDFRYEAILT